MRRASLVIVAVLLSATTLHGQRGRGGPSVVSPEVHADRTVTFRLLAPNAREVALGAELDGTLHPMTRDGAGIWSVTVGPLPPEIYAYTVNADGIPVLDPRNANTKLGYGNFGAVSLAVVPGDGPQFYDVKPVLHVARTMWVSSGAQGIEQNYPAFFADPTAVNKQFKLLWVGVGKDDALATGGSRVLDDVLTRRNIRHVYRVTGGRHEWSVWRHHLHEVTPLLFR